MGTTGEDWLASRPSFMHIDHFHDSMGRGKGPQISSGVAFVLPGRCLVQRPLFLNHFGKVWAVGLSVRSN